MQPRSLAPLLTLYGRVESDSLFKAAAPAPSRVDRVLVREGERVDRGQLLVVLDPRDFLPRLTQARAEVAELEAQLRSEELRHRSDGTALEQEQKLLQLAREGVQRARKLLGRNLGSDAELDAAEQEVARQELAVTKRRLDIADHPARSDALQARLSRARAALEEIELDYERSEVRSPNAAIVAGVEVAEGDRVAANSVLLSLYSPKSLEVRARIPAVFQQELQQTLASGYPLRGEMHSGAEPVELTLVRTAGEADPSGVDAFFHIDTGRQRLRSGQLLRFTLQRRPRENAVPVPYQSVYGGERLYLLEEGRLRRVTVEPLGAYLDEPGDERLLVQAPGLKSGDRLVITHLPNAIEGLRVEDVERKVDSDQSAVGSSQ
jgi:multidrug efflux pump subunit AcrA (membrane-fusion protein)